ncbi:hypothetical protein CTAYLR_006748 [Chrysophaeum taylorii]|uniref:Amino acid transporter transmembrane domain-containing protein n=1 Tax=Chrysophaeum taylorii TaxID=2483200 RepID=A0AAD7XHK3_9STRA|nr:hypothetical protein CTAYLR_006748 [Chrysophaeum taylorii]
MAACAAFEEDDDFAKAMHMVLSTPPPPPRRFIPLIQRGRPPSLELLSPAATSPLREAPLWGCVGTMLSTMIGGGVLSLPYALKLTGLTFGLPLLVLSAAASDFALYALCSASRRTGTATLAELARHAQGPRLENVVLAALFVLCAFVSVAYARLLRDLISLFLHPFEASTGTVDRCLVGAAVAVLFPLSLNKELHRLRYAAFTSFAGAICVAALFVYRATPRRHRVAEILWPPADLDLSAALEALPIMVLLFLCQFNVLSIHARLHNPTRPRLKLLIHVAIGVTVLFYIVIGVAGTLVCADAPLSVTQDALSCLAATTRTSSDALLACAGGAFACSILLNTPALIIPLRDSLGLVFEKCCFCNQRQNTDVLPVVVHEKSSLRPNPNPNLGGLDDQDQKLDDDDDDDDDARGERRSPAPLQGQGQGRRRWFEFSWGLVVHVGITAAIISAVVVAAQRVPGVASVWAVCGSSVGLFVAFMLPCGLYLRVRGDKEGHKALIRQAVCAILVISSASLAIVCTYRNARAILFFSSG